MSVTVNIPLDSLGIKWERLWEETGNGGYVPERELLVSYNDVIREIRKVCRPAFCYEILECEGVCDGKLTVGGKTAAGGITLNPGKRIAGYLEKAEKIAVYVGTAGTGFEDYCRELNRSRDVIRAFFADTAGSVIAEAVSGHAFRHISDKESESGYRTSFPYSPGHCEWPVSDQEFIFALLPDSPCGIRLTDSGLMIPVKSVSGIVGIGKNIERKPFGCAICTFEGCYKKHVKDERHPVD